MSGTQVARLFATVEVDSRRFERGMRSVDAHARRVTRTVNKTTRGFDKLDRGIRAARRGQERLASSSRRVDRAKNTTRRVVDSVRRSLERMGRAARIASATMATQTSRAFRRMRAGAARVRASLAGVMRSMRRVGIAAGVMAAAAAAGIVVVGKNLFELGASAQEQENKFKEIFEGDSSRLEKQLFKLARTTSMGRNEAIEAAAAFGALIKPVGLTGKETARLSKEFVEIGNDMASFFETTPEEAFAALTSALAGQSRPMQRFGVLLTQDRLKAEALSMGLIKTAQDTSLIAERRERLEIATQKLAEVEKKHGKASSQYRSAAVARTSAERSLSKAMEGKRLPMSRDAKLMATIALIQRDTAAATGDAARTYGSAANQAKALTQNWRDFRTELGKQTLPVVTKLLVRMNKALQDDQIAKAAEGVVAGVVTRLDSLLGWVAKNGPNLMENLTRIFKTLKPILEGTLVPLVQGFVGGLEEARGESARGEGPLAGLATAMERFAVAVSEPEFQSSMRELGRNLGALVALLGSAGALVGWVARTWVRSAAMMTEAGEGVTNNIYSIIDALRETAAQLERAGEWTRGVWDGLVDGFRSAINQVITMWNGLSLTLPSVEIPGLGKVGGGTLSTPQVPLLASGGTARRSGSAIVGERGPELLHLPRGASVVPLGAATGGGGTSINIQRGAIVINGSVGGDVNELADKIGAAIERRVRRTLV
jgi:hypothetical protein